MCIRDRISIARVGRINLLIIYDDGKALHSQSISHVFDPRDPSSWNVEYVPINGYPIVLTCIDFGDSGYYLTPLSPGDIAFTKANYFRLTDINLRAHIWKRLFDTIQVRQLSLGQLVEILLAVIDSEESSYLIELLFTAVWLNLEGSKESDVDKLKESVGNKAREIKSRFKSVPLLTRF
eukprot:TRINITY_DN8708_c0_g1_i3.p1 TRINITY_DN8708_c0_g1~~TRINITY_DN8708_c0_g1_i3.p1  ORF type:complete len:179 (-),score=12.55 TRINITY_DN8708_c0_g1_i3:30-566(-)